MNHRQVAPLCILVLLISVSSLAQSKHDKTILQIEPMLLGEPGLSYFLPRNDDAWSLTVVSSGGIMGGNKLVAAVNSEGTYLCPQNDSVVRKFIVRQRLEKLSDLISSLDIDAARRNIGLVPPLQSCNDCVFKTLIFSRRVREKTEKDKTEVETFSFRLTNEDGAVKRILEETAGLISCR